jgi:hypothetical protein
VGLLPASLAAQARVDAILPAAADVVVHRLGADRPEAAAVGMVLEPGDLLEAEAEGVSISLSCSAPEGTNTYLVDAPFRVLIDVPTTASCHVNLLSGLTEVVAEAPTETTAGGVTLGSTGTQYAVELRRLGSELVFNCYVYDESIRVLSNPSVTAAAGQKLVWSGLQGVALRANTPRDLARSAATYARFDLAAATTSGATVHDTAATRRALTALHMEVLAHPADTAKRVALAKEQIRYDVRDRAAYNLRRVNVRDDAQLRRYQIDPSTVTVPTRRPGNEVTAITRARPDVRAATDVVAAAAPTTDGDLRLIAAGRVDEAIAHLEARVESGYAHARDHYALAKAYALRGDDDQVRAHVSRALVLSGGGDALSAAELGELGALIGRLD